MYSYLGTSFNSAHIIASSIARRARIENSVAITIKRIEAFEMFRVYRRVLKISWMDKITNTI